MKRLILLSTLVLGLAACSQQTFPAQYKLIVTLSGPEAAPIKIVDSTGQVFTDDYVVSGTIRVLKAGMYTVQPGDYPGYQTPVSQLVDLTKGDVTVKLVYYPYIEPPVTPKALWRR